MDLAIPALFALSVGGVLSIDEIDGSLHPLLLRELVSYFDNSELNPLGAQLLFSTHDLTLLGKSPAESLHRGEVWLVEKRDLIPNLSPWTSSQSAMPTTSKSDIFKERMALCPSLTQPSYFILSKHYEKNTLK